MFNHLLDELNKKGNEVYAYKDDLAVNKLDRDKLEICHDIIEKWVEENNMKINKKKLGIVFDNKKTSSEKQIKGREIR